MSEKEIMADIEFAYEQWRGTKEAEELIIFGYYTAIALHFCKFYIKSRGLHGKKN